MNGDAPGGSGPSLGDFSFPLFLRLFRFRFPGVLISQALIDSAVGILVAVEEGDIDNLIDVIVEALANAGFDVAAPIIRQILIDTLSGVEPDDGETDPAEEIEEGIDDANDEVKDIVIEQTDKVIREVERGREELGNIIFREAGRVIGDVLEGIGGLSDRVESIFTGIESRIGDSLGILGDIFNLVSGRLSVAITNIINLPEDIFGTIIDGVSDIVDEHLRYFNNLFDDVFGILRDIFGDQAEALAEPVDEIGKAIKEQTDQQEESSDELVDEVKLINDKSDEGTGASLLESAIKVIEERYRDGEPPEWAEFYKGFDDQMSAACGDDFVMADKTNELLKMGSATPILIGQIMKYLAQFEDDSGIIDSTLQKAYYYLAKAQGVLTISGALAARELYEFAYCVPYEIFEPGDAIAAYQRNLITREQVETDLRMRGYNEARVDVLIETGYQVPDLAALYSMNLRGLPAGENLTDRLQDLGYSPSDAEGLEALKFYIPPPQDLITMAVREVFNPTIVEKFGQDEDFPEDFATYAAEQGISRFWAEKYWQAHWVLPSVQMGYEMLHRGVIDQETLKQLLAAQDVMPGWRQGLIDISYSPYTRVDIRRMHDVGVLDDAEVLRAYKDIGYDDDKAANLTEFTIRLNTDEDELPPELDGLTRASVLAAFKDGIITRTDADSMLTDAGIGQEAREIFLTGIELDVDREERQDDVDLILTEYENGVIGLLSATLELQQLPLTELEREKAEKKLRKLRAKKTKMPSKSELDRLFKAQLIDEDEYEEQLERIGYPDTYIRKFRQLIESGQAADA